MIITAKKIRRQSFDEKELETFLSSDPEYNNSDEEEFRKKIREYIKQNITCDKIPLTVSLGYPHDFSGFKHFRVVDTPGVNATGGIEDRTKEFINDNEADAAIYLHKAPPVESKALRNALTNELPEKVKYRLLVLTHRSGQDEDRNVRILNEAKRLHSEIGLDNIFFVDSLAELDLQKFYGAKTINEINAIRGENQQLRGRTAHFFEEADGNRSAFLKLLEEQANFRDIRKRIESDARKSDAIQMRDFAYALQDAYKDLDKIIEGRIAPLEMKYREPQFFASKKQRQEDKMKKMEGDYSEFIHSLREDFSTGNENNRYSQEMNQIVKGVIDEIKKRKFDSNDHNYQEEENSPELCGEFKTRLR